MAKFELELPNDVLKEFEQIYGNTEKIFGEMTRAGAEITMQAVKSNVPKAFQGSNIMSCLKLTRTYRTPSDGGINTKVGFYGYFINKNGVKTPAPLVCNVFEYGSTHFSKKPFFRKSFRADEITRAMLEAQKRASGGLLDE